MSDTAQPAADGFPKSDWTPPATGIQLAPGGEADARARGLIPPAAPAFDPAPAVAPKLPVDVKYLSGRVRSVIYDLLEPIAVNGVEIRQVVIRRVSGAEVRAFGDQVREAEDGESLPYPIFRHVDDAPLSPAEWGVLDDDDVFALTQRADPFLSARFKSVMSNEPSSPPAPATTDNTSAQSLKAD